MTILMLPLYLKRSGRHGILFIQNKLRQNES